MTIYEIKAEHEAAHPGSHFFDRATMRFFHQTMRSFSVHKIDETHYRIAANMKDSSGRLMGVTARIFNTTTKALEHEQRE